LQETGEVVLASRKYRTVDQFEQAGVPLHFRGPAGVSPRRPNAGAQTLGSVPKKLPSIVFLRTLRIGAGLGELIVWVLERSGGSNPVKTEAKSIAASPPELATGEQQAPCEVFFPAAYASREAKVSFSPQRERTDPHDPRSLRTESFRDLTPCDSEGGLRAADFAAQRRAALGGNKLPKP